METLQIIYVSTTVMSEQEVAAVCTSDESRDYIVAEVLRKKGVAEDDIRHCLDGIRDRGFHHHASEYSSSHIHIKVQKACPNKLLI